MAFVGGTGALSKSKGLGHSSIDVCRKVKETTFDERTLWVHVRSYTNGVGRRNDDRMRRLSEHSCRSNRPKPG